MPVTVKKILLWRTEVDNKPGTLASTMGPPARAGADVKVVMGYRHPTAGGKAAIEIYPITGRKLMAAAVAAGLSAAAIPTLLVEGDNKPGLGYVPNSRATGSSCWGDQSLQRWLPKPEAALSRGIASGPVLW